MTDHDEQAVSTEAAVIAELARESRVGQTVDLGVPHLVGVIERGAGGSVRLAVEDLEPFAPRPRRAAGHRVVFDADSFVHEVRALGHPAETRVYADVVNYALVAVLDDDTARPVGDDVSFDAEPPAPGWRRHRVSLQLQPTEAWEHWRSRDGVLGEQVDFARHVEDGIDQIVRPSQADMLEVAQRFEATVDVRFRSGARLRDGSRQLLWEEDVQASAGEVVVPDEFVLRMSPWEGVPGTEVTARLRFEIRQGRLAIGYRLVHPKEHERACFEGLVQRVIDELPEFAVVNGRPPERA